MFAYLAKPHPHLSETRIWDEHYPICCPLWVPLASVLRIHSLMCNPVVCPNGVVHSW